MIVKYDCDAWKVIDDDGNNDNDDEICLWRMIVMYNCDVW